MDSSFSGILAKNGVGGIKASLASKKLAGRFYAEQLRKHTSEKSSRSPNGGKTKSPGFDSKFNNNFSLKFRHYKNLSHFGNISPSPLKPLKNNVSIEKIPQNASINKIQLYKSLKNLEVKNNINILFSDKAVQQNIVNVINFKTLLKATKIASEGLDNLSSVYARQLKRFCNEVLYKM